MNIHEEFARIFDEAAKQDDEATRTLRAMVRWHKQNEDEELPTALLALLMAAREIC